MGQSKSNGQIWTHQREDEKSFCSEVQYMEGRRNIWQNLPQTQRDFISSPSFSTDWVAVWPWAGCFSLWALIFSSKDVAVPASQGWELNEIIQYRPPSSPRHLPYFSEGHYYNFTLYRRMQMVFLALFLCSWVELPAIKMQVAKRSS